uniref:hypothetical protein n=1 Tax=Petrachloros mirabilis TaxID=2918835 RepID=UPI0030845779
MWGTFAFQSRLAPRYDAVRDQAGLISDRLSNNLSGMATIKSFTAEAYERDRVYSDSEAYRRGNSRAIAICVDSACSRRSATQPSISRMV